MRTFYVYIEGEKGSRAVYAKDINEAWKEARILFGQNISVESR